MSDFLITKKEQKPNIISVRVEEVTFKKVYAIAQEYAYGSMSDVVRYCIELAINPVEEIYRKKKEAERSVLRKLK